jgi:hypothetical protein
VLRHPVSGPAISFDGCDSLLTCGHLRSTFWDGLNLKNIWR